MQNKLKYFLKTAKLCFGPWRSFVHSLSCRGKFPNEEENHQDCNKKKNYFSQFLTLQVICFTRKIKSEVAEEHHLVAISDYCVMLTQWRLNQYDLGRFLGKITSLLIKFYNLKCKLGSFYFFFTTDKNCSDRTDLHFLACECEKKNNNRTLFTFFLMILMMNRPDGSLSFLLTLSKTLFLNREHDLFLKKKKTIYNKSTDRNDNTQRIFVYLFPNHKNFDFFFFWIWFLSWAVLSRRCGLQMLQKRNI